MSQLSSLILAANPMQEEQITGDSSTIAHMAYRMDPQPRLMRLTRKPPGSGGLLYVSLGGETIHDSWDFFFQQLQRECAARNYRGVIVDFPKRQGGVIRALDSFLHERGLAFYLPEQFHRDAPNAKLLVSTAISGGSLRQRLEQAFAAYGKARVVPAAELTREDFTPPAPSGGGKPLTSAELTQLRQKLRPNVFWSPELCARYFTYTASDRRTHFVLFDDPETIRAKIRLAGELGCGECLAAWGDLHPE